MANRGVARIEFDGADWSGMNMVEGTCGFALEEGDAGLRDNWSAASHFSGWNRSTRDSLEMLISSSIVPRWK